MVKDCPNCGYKNNQNVTYCISCGALINARSKSQSWVTHTEGGGSRPATFIIILALLVIFGAMLLIIGQAYIGLGVMVLASIYGFMNGEKYFSSLSGVVYSILLGMMFRALPGSQLISMIGVVVFWCILILELPYPKLDGELRSKDSALFGFAVTVYALAIVSSIVYPIILIFYTGGGFQEFTSYLIPIVSVAPIFITILLKSPLEAGPKLGLIVACALPIMIYIGIAAWYSSATWLGNFRDQANMLFTRGIGGGSTSSDPILSMILNPKLAVQAQLQPVTTTEVKTTTTSPTVAFSASGEALPKAGCYDTSAFQIIGKVKNTGGEFIKDIDLILQRYDTASYTALPANSPCREWTFSSPSVDGKTCSYDIDSLPSEVTLSRSCMIESVPAPEEQLEEVAQAHTCYIDVHAKTGYHATSRLGVEFMDSDYARLKLEKRQLTLSEKPATVSTGPVSFSIGGFQQPVIYYAGAGSDEENQVTLITSISNKGGGNVTYKSAYMYIPNALLDDGQCGNPTLDDWECMKSLTKGNDNDFCVKDGENTGLSDSQAKTYCQAFNNFYNTTLGNLIGEYKQFSYDNSDGLLNPVSDYSICFYKEEINPTTVNIGTCTLTIGNVMDKIRDPEILRKTLLIRGDVLYVYDVFNSVSIDLRDCNI